MEYLPHGDLSSLLERQRERERLCARARDGYTWFATDGPIKRKSLLALDIAEALVYLHSFERPIIHWDLKPKNVLLSASWEAKVTDFGTSRALEEDDQTLTAKIGTVAWIAPEILRGVHYSEKADVHSFGVLLTELDTCCRPYAQGILPGESRHDRILSNTRIAVLVSDGSLRPHVRGDCPQSVSHLVEKCLAYDPVDRPSALQLHYELRKI
ncbi:hypothetical protein PsorP6_009286 [Peronosclerospora sorghi]|uniref:Uncharacterized protein n=1 Tax=Peronosclerospora sorghi TaxID=230839 RepID=A0ACC0W1E6_9STRA|nr:hypothetical protein PsorP6_009286 [Peronosclerospora sorghi]